MRGEERFVFDLSRIAGFSTRLLITACTTTDKDRRHLSRRPARKFLTTPPLSPLVSIIPPPSPPRGIYEEGRGKLRLKRFNYLPRKLLRIFEFLPAEKIFYPLFEHDISRVYPRYFAPNRRIFFQPTELKRAANCFHL